MILSVFTVYDSKVGAYMLPFTSPSKGSAMRLFADTCEDPGSAFNKHPEDYTLFHLGTFDDSDASYDLLATPESMGVAVEFMNKGE